MMTGLMVLTTLATELVIYLRKPIEVSASPMHGFGRVKQPAAQWTTTLERRLVRPEGVGEFAAGGDDRHLRRQVRLETSS